MIERLHAELISTHQEVGAYMRYTRRPEEEEETAWKEANLAIAKPDACSCSTSEVTRAADDGCFTVLGDSGRDRKSLG